MQHLLRDAACAAGPLMIILRRYDVELDSLQGPLICKKSQYFPSSPRPAARDIQPVTVFQEVLP
jgi:hypothetical protein